MDRVSLVDAHFRVYPETVTQTFFQLRKKPVRILNFSNSKYKKGMWKEGIDKRHLSEDEDEDDDRDEE